MPIELISTFRKKISSNTLYIIGVLVALIVVVVFFRIKIHDKNPFLEGALPVIVIVLLNIIAFFLDRKSSRIKSLKSSEPTIAIKALEEDLQNEHHSFRKSRMYVFMAGTILMIATLVLIFSQPHAWFTGAIFIGAIGLILIPMLKGWVLMQDAMMLQDIKHAVRNHTSEIS